MLFCCGIIVLHLKDNFMQMLIIIIIHIYRATLSVRHYAGILPKTYNEMLA